MPDSQFKRNIAYKMKIGSIITGKPVMEGDRIKSLDTEGKNIVRANVIGNITDKYIQEGEKKFGSITLDDGTGQIKAKAFGDDVDKFNELNMGDTLAIIGLVRSWNNEIYLTPEIVKKKDPAYLLLRKLEVEADAPKILNKEAAAGMKDKIIEMVKEAEAAGGVDIEKIILTLKEHPDSINSEIKRLLEEGMVYEPRPGKLRWLG